MKLFKISKNILLPLNIGFFLLFNALMFGPGDVYTDLVIVSLIVSAVFWIFVIILFRNYIRRFTLLGQNNTEVPPPKALFVLLLSPFVLFVLSFIGGLFLIFLERS